MEKKIETALDHGVGMWVFDWYWCVLRDVTAYLHFASHAITFLLLKRVRLLACVLTPSDVTGGKRPRAGMRRLHTRWCQICKARVAESFSDRR
jgi:hypothetical protein